MKNNGKILLSLIFTSFICFAIALLSLAMPKGSASEFNGVYNVNAFAEEGDETPDGEGEENEQPKQEVSATVYATRCNVSTTKDYILMVTAFNAEPSAYSEIGYNVSINGEEPVQIGTNKYYTGLVIKSSTGADVTLTATEIYGQEIDHVGLIVYEMEYDPANVYSITAYMTPNTNYEEENNATVNPGTGNGAIAGNMAQSIEIGGNYVVNAGDSLEGLDVQVVGNFRDGQRVLDRSEYSLSIPEGEAKFGNGYKITATYLKNENLTASKTVAVAATFQSEDATIVGGQKVAETGYTPDLQSVGTINSVGEFAKTVIGGKEGSITYTFTAKTAGVANLVFRMANSNLRNPSTDVYQMAQLQLNTVMDLTVNGGNVAFGNDVVIPGSKTNTGKGKVGYGPLYNIYHDVAINGVTLKAGLNTVKISFKVSTTGETNSWGESPSTANVDYMTVMAANNVITDGATITAIEVDSLYKPAYGDAIANTAAVAIMSDGQQMALEKGEFTVTNGEKDWYAVSNSIVVKLASDATITATKTIATSVTLSAKYKTADLVQEDGKIYYKLTFDSKGYEVSDYTIFNDSTTYAITKYEHTPTQMAIYTDVTGLGVGNTLWPHVKIKGANYTGTNANGDIAGGTYEVGKTFSANGKRFILFTEYKMPTVRIVNASEKHLALAGKGIFLETNKAAGDTTFTKIYYSIEFEMWGYDGSTFTLFDGDKAYNVTIPTITNIYHVVKFDVSSMTAAGATLWPHLRINGTNYNGFDYQKGTAGDLKFTGTFPFTDGQSVKKSVTRTDEYKFLNYTIDEQYGMPTLVTRLSTT